MKCRFFGDGVTQRDCTPGILGGCGGEVCRCEGDSVDTVTAGVSSEEDHDLSGSAGVVDCELVPLDDSETSDVDETVSGVLLVEEESSGDGGDTHPVSVVPDSGDDSVGEVLGVLDSLGKLLLGVDGSETEGVDESDGLCTHTDDVPEDSSDTGGGSTVGFDGGGVVVTLDPECVSVIVVEDHDSCVSSGEDVGVVDGEDELLEDVLGALVTAVLAPCLTESLKLDVGGVPAFLLEVVDDDLHLVECETESHLGGELLELLVGGGQDVHIIDLIWYVAFDHKPVNGHLSSHRDRVVLDDRVGEELPAHLLSHLLGLIGRCIDVHLEDFDELDGVHTGETECLDGLLGVLSLGVRNAFLQFDSDFNYCHMLLRMRARVYRNVFVNP